MPSDVSSLWTAPLVMRRADSRVSVPTQGQGLPWQLGRVIPLSPASLRTAEQALAQPPAGFPYLWSSSPGRLCQCGTIGVYGHKISSCTL